MGTFFFSFMDCPLFCYDITVFYDVAVHDKDIAKEKKKNIRVFLSILDTVYLRNPFTRVVENGEDTFTDRCS